jgi:cystathionine beta-lyase/cystathionine gamma-synthase
MSRFATRLATAQLPESPDFRPVNPPIVLSTTFHMDDELLDSMSRGDYRSGYLYTRMGNPTVRALEHKLAELHGAADGVTMASGMGALSAFLFGLTAPGDTIIAAQQLYGVTASLLRSYVAPAGRNVVFVDLGNPDALDAALSTSTNVRWVLGETVSNPLCSVLDIGATSRLAHLHGARLAIDNTFVGPAICRPLEHGADLVIESLSKSIAGHSDVHGGAVVGSREDCDTVWQAMIHLGACLDPHAAYLVLRGLKTLAMRTDTSCANAARIAAALNAHAEVDAVYYPGIAHESGEVVAHAQLDSPGYMLSFVVSGGDERAQRLLNALTTVAQATSLGGVESLASLPFNTSHRTPEARASVGLRPGTVRLSVGCEDIDDLLADLASALNATR